MQSKLAAQPDGLSTSESIVAAATQLFLTDGYTCTSADQIAKQCRVSKKTVYKIFGSKSELLRVVIKRVLDRVEDSTRNVIEDSSMPIVDRFAGLIQGIDLEFERVRSPRFLNDVHSSAPNVWREFMDWREQRIQAISKITEDAAASGGLTEGMHPREVMAVWVSILGTCMEGGILDEFDLPSSEIYNGLTQVLVHGITV